MLLSKLKIGDRIDHYCSGQMVQGKVSKVQNNGVMSSHKPIRWGSELHTETFISPPSDLQRFSNGRGAIPKCLYKGELVTV